MNGRGLPVSELRCEDGERPELLAIRTFTKFRVMTGSGREGKRYSPTLVMINGRSIRNGKYPPGTGRDLQGPGPDRQPSTQKEVQHFLIEGP